MIRGRLWTARTEEGGNCAARRRVGLRIITGTEEGHDLVRWAIPDGRSGNWLEVAQCFLFHGEVRLQIHMRRAWALMAEHHSAIAVMSTPIAAGASPWCGGSCEARSPGRQEPEVRMPLEQRPGPVAESRSISTTDDPRHLRTDIPVGPHLADGAATA